MIEDLSTWTEITDEEEMLYRCVLEPNDKNFGE